MGTNYTVTTDRVANNYPVVTIDSQKEYSKTINITALREKTKDLIGSSNQISSQKKIDKNPFKKRYHK